MLLYVLQFMVRTVTPYMYLFTACICMHVCMYVCMFTYEEDRYMLKILCAWTYVYNFVLKTLGYVYNVFESLIFLLFFRVRYHICRYRHQRNRIISDCL